MANHIPLPEGKRYDAPPPDSNGHLPEWPQNRSNGMVWCMACCLLLEADDKRQAASKNKCKPAKLGLR